MTDYIVHKAVEVGALSKATLNRLEQPGGNWIITPKYDGCHAVLLFDDGEFVQAISRTGERAVSMTQVGRDIADHGLLPKGQRVAICGEAWHPERKFNEISGEFRRKVPSPWLGFKAFDCLGWAHRGVNGSLWLGSHLCYSDRLSGIERLPPECWAPVVRYTGSLPGALAMYRSLAVEYQETGVLDGVIIAAANGSYTQGAGKGGEFIKLKPLASHTVVVRGREVSTGTKTGKHTCALVFYHDGLEQRVSTGLTQEQIDSVATSFDEDWLGASIEVEAMGKTVNGYLREPRFKGVRTDA